MSANDKQWLHMRFELSDQQLKLWNELRRNQAKAQTPPVTGETTENDCFLDTCEDEVEAAPPKPNQDEFSFPCEDDPACA